MKKLLAVITVVMLAAFAAPAFAATNPFMDVPASHWAYDAVAQLAARGVISGYPDGTFKGPQPATRYEIASIIARSLAYVDLDKASKADVEMMRRLIVEFGDELNALGVTVDAFDGRLGQLEKDLGGWKLSGVFEFNAKIGDDRLGGSDADWDVDKYRIFIDRRINETTAFHARLGKGVPGTPSGHSNDGTAVRWDYYYITTKLGYDIELSAGRFVWDWEGELGLYIDDDAWMNDIIRQGFGFRKDFGIANFALLLQRLSDDDYISPAAATAATAALSNITTAPATISPGGEEWYRVAFNLNGNFSEKFSAGLLGYFDIADIDSDNDIMTFGAYLKFRFHPSVELKGLYYHQDAEDAVGDTANAWKAVLDIDQDLLKFTSLWIEYAQVDGLFIFDTGDSTYAGYTNFDAGPNNNVTNAGEDLKFILVKATQQWNDKWDTWVRYNWADYDNNGDDFSQIGVGVGYQLNPAVHFDLGYDYAEYNNGTDDNLIRFQTVVNF